MYTIQEDKLVRISWNQFGQLCDELEANLKKYLAQNNLKVDLIVPILREGGFTGLTLAYKLNTYKILPIQFKYLLFEGRSELTKISSFPDVTYEIPAKPVILLCDTFPAGGNTKKLAVAEIKKRFPESRIIFASLVGDPSTAQIPEIVANVFVMRTDSDGNTDHSLAKEMGFTNTMNLVLPWENVAEEIASVTEKEYKYN